MSPQFGDFDDDGDVDMVAGSNCCAATQFHLFLRNKNGTFDARRDLRLVLSEPSGDLPSVNTQNTVKQPFEDLLRRIHPIPRGLTQPHLVDWDRDGFTDLVVSYPGSYSHSGPLWVSRGPLAAKQVFSVKRVECFPKNEVVDLSIGDLDNDEMFDLIFAWSRYDEATKLQRYGISWKRNSTTSGEPVFADAQPLIEVSPPWRLIAFSLIDWDIDGRADVVISVHKGNRKDGYESEQWLYQRQQPAITKR